MKPERIRIERKSEFTHQIFEIENRTLTGEPHYCGLELWCTVELNKEYTEPAYRTPLGGTLEISAI